MRRQWYGRDIELQARMFLTMFLLAAVYLAFIVVLLAAGVDVLFVAIIAAILLGIQFFFSDKIALLSMGAKVVSPQEEPRLHGLVGRLAALANLPKPRVAISDMDIPNAFATGRDPQHAVVAVTRGLLQRVNERELEAVLGHELSHIKNRDVMVITIASFFSMVAAFLMRMFMFSAMFGGRGDRRQGGAGAVLLMYLVSLLVWIISFLLIRALSRYREYAADRGSAIITGSPSDLGSALLKISGVMARIPQRDLRQVESMNAFFILPAISGSALAELFSTHPPLEKRLERLKRMQQEMEGR
ncbi:MAG: zinc metalloprotease HtpX [Chloroflexi bacterium]|nr:zinc metalloprotease HtpX [Chloroflexota bacterium]